MKIKIFVFALCLAAGNLKAADDLRPSAPAMMMPIPMAEEKVVSKTGLVPFQESAAYKQYSRRPKTEFSKLIYLMERLKIGSQKILYNGRSYEPAQIVGLVKAYIALNYKKERAEDWIKANAYRSISKGRVIYIQYPDGTSRPLRDVLLEELALISSAA